jgi:hypothetical protein
MLLICFVAGGGGGLWNGRGVDLLGRHIKLILGFMRNWYEILVVRSVRMSDSHRPLQNIRPNIRLKRSAVATFGRTLAPGDPNDNFHLRPLPFLGGDRTMRA